MRRSGANDPGDRSHPGGRLPRTRADQLGFGEVGRPHRARTQDALVRHARSAQAAVPVDDAVFRRAATGPVAARRHRAGDPARRPPARFGVRAAAPPLDGTPSRTRRPDAGADLRLAERPRAPPAGSPTGNRRCCAPPTSSSSTARSAPRCGSSCPITSTGVSSSNSACWQGNTTVWRRPCRPWRSRWTIRAITSSCRPPRATTVEPEAPATRARTTPA